MFVLDDIKFDFLVEQLARLAPRSGVLDVVGGTEIQASESYPLFSLNTSTDLKVLAYEDAFTFSDTILVPLGVDSSLVGCAIASFTTAQPIEILDSEVVYSLSDAIACRSDTGDLPSEARLIRIPEFGCMTLWLYSGAEVSDEFFILAPKPSKGVSPTALSYSQFIAECLILSEGSGIQI